VRTGASGRNWASYGDAVDLPAGLEDWRRDLLTDPQTSGGLLIAVAADQAGRFWRSRRPRASRGARSLDASWKARRGCAWSGDRMIRRTVDLSPAARDGFDAIIDVRSPAEFALDHIPGAINLPVLDDAQRAAVGTEYVQGSKFLARRTGAAMVARNIAAHLEGALADRDGSFRPLVYCWRGGQRSGAMVTVMDQIGWPVTVLDGGYQTWRRQVTAGLYDTPLPHRLTLLDGPTGSGKTAC
jgi:rhodanese-related sulfurtransferase